MANSRLIKGYIATILSTILWGASFVWTGELLQTYNFTPITIVFCRMVIASILMFAIFSAMGKIERLKKKDVKIFVLLALFQPFLYFIGETYGLKFVGEASFAAVMIALIPVFAPFALSIIYKRKLKGELVVGAIVSVLGVVLMSLNLGGQGISIIGILWLIEAIITACGYNVVLQTLLDRGYSAITITTYQNVFAAIFYIPLFFIMDFKTFPTIIWTGRAVFDILALSVLCSAIAYMCYSYGARIISLEKEAIFNNAIPVVTIIMSVMMGQEMLTIRKVLGMIVVILGLMLSQQNFIKKPKQRNSKEKTKE
ncbi:MAG: DMT family transporter [Bacteroidales bacterium]|nr:DMT family transporter [Bacteroidales bacterium]